MANQTKTTEERLLVLILRLGGILTGSALFTIFLPVDWMASTHRWLGLGEYPDATITNYLARSLSAMYALHGGFLLIISSDIQRFRPMVLYVGISNIIFGVVLFFIDRHAAMPEYWTFSEGPPVFLIGLLVLWLERRLPMSAEQG